MHKCPRPLNVKKVKFSDTGGGISEDLTGYQSRESDNGIGECFSRQIAANC